MNDTALDSISNAFNYEIQFDEYFTVNEQEQVLGFLNDKNEQLITREMGRFESLSDLYE
jgi:hypothetical protein